MANQPRKKRIDDDPPLSPDSGQKPVLLQRRRVWRACESCRRKKIKCDGNEPTCSQCTASGSHCTWLQTKDRAALSRHYVQELEARLLHMESLFAKLAPALNLEQIETVNGISAAGATSANASASGAGESASNSVPPKSAMAIDRKEAGSPTDSSSGSVIDDFSESFGQLALDDHGHLRWIGGSSTMSLIQSFRALTESPINRSSPMDEDPRAPGPSANKLYFPASVFFGKVRALPQPEEAEYPPRDLADKLVDAYFSRFHFFLPVIDKPTFLRQYKILMDNQHDPALARSEAAFMSLVFAVFACSARLVDDPRLSAEKNLDDGGMGMYYYERALILHYISHTSIQIAHVQCFILMSSFLCSVNCLPQAWLLVGQAVRIGQDLGLHRSPRRLLISAIEKETRRKIWWGLYTLDRMLALALGRPLGVEDADCDVEYPVAYDDDELPAYFNGAQILQTTPSLMTGFISLTSLYKIAGRVLRKVYALDVCRDQLDLDKKSELHRNVEVLDQELTRWCDNLPLVFKSEHATEKQVSMSAVLCSHYYSILTTLHRNFLPVKRELSPAPKSVARALSSARSCIRLAPSIRDMVPPSHHLAFFIQHLFSSAVILLLYAMHASDTTAATAAMMEAKSSLSAIEWWEGHWPGARKCKELLIELSNTAEEAIRKADASNVPTLSPTVPTAEEKRRSVTLSSPSAQTAPGRVTKTGKHARNLSRDARESRRQLATPYHVDSQKARSPSRRRGDRDGLEGAKTVSFGQSLSGSGSPHLAQSSPHSSPASGTLPSPPLSVAEQFPETAARHGRVMPSYSYANVPISPVQVPSDTRYEYGLQRPLAGSNSWSANNGDQNGLEIFRPGPQTDVMTVPGTYTGDAGYYSYDAPDFSSYPTLSTTPPSSFFAASGLPFSGLDYIRNYDPGTYITDGEMESLWQTFDPGTFGLDPEIPFSLGDVSTTEQVVGQ